MWTPLVRLPQVGGGGGLFILYDATTATVCKLCVCVQTIWVVVDGAATKSSFRDSFFVWFVTIRYLCTNWSLWPNWRVCCLGLICFRIFSIATEGKWMGGTWHLWERQTERGTDDVLMKLGNKNLPVAILGTEWSVKRVNTCNKVSE